MVVVSTNVRTFSQNFSKFIMAQTKTTQRKSQAPPQNISTTALLTTSSSGTSTSTAPSGAQSTSGTSGPSTSSSSPSTIQKPSTRSAVKGSPAFQYEQSLNQVLCDLKMLLKMSDGKTELALTLVYAVFDVMCTRGHEIEKGNPEIVINLIQD